MRRMKLVSVVMSTYNETNVEIEDAVNSILSQTYKNLELIIVNDNPSNVTLRKQIDFLCKRDSRIKVITNAKNIGLASSLNKAINLAKGFYIARMDADDISYSNRIYEEISYLELNKDIALVSTNCVYINENGVEIGEKSAIPTNPKKIAKILPIGSSIIHPTVVFRRKIFETMGGYRILPTAEDYDFWLRMISNNYKLASLNKPLLKYRIRSESMTQSKQMLVMLVSSYERLLFKQRMKNGKDNFSKADLEKYLKKKGYYDKRRQNFDKSSKYFLNGISNLKNQKYFLGLREILRALFLSFAFWSYFRRFIEYKMRTRIMRDRGN